MTGSRCSNCGQNIRPGAPFCGACGTPANGSQTVARSSCPHCGSALREGAQFCAACGTSVEVERTPGPTREAERVGFAINPAFIIAAALLGVTLVVLGVIFFTRSGSESATADDSTVPSPAAIASTTAVPSSAAAGGESREPAFPVVTTQTPTASTAVVSTATSTDTGRLPGDLGLAQLMTRPRCDGQYIVMLGASITPSVYASEIQMLLSRFPDSEYLRTDSTCASLRSQVNGNPIYSVYYGPYPTRAEACAVRTTVGGDSYVKVLDTFTDSSVLQEC
jgi:serine/threonine-protein kinase